MTRKQHTEEQIIAVLEEAQAGIGVPELWIPVLPVWAHPIGDVRLQEFKTHDQAGP